MSVEVETRSLARFLPRGMRRLLGTDDPQNSTSAVEVVPNAPVGHVYAMFQGAQNTTIQRPIFNIHAAGTSAGVASHPDSTTLQQSTSSQEALNPTHFIPMNAGSVLPLEPIPVPKTSAEVYVHHLMMKDSGYPLWIPSPSMRLPTSYRASGVSIGDVGIITPEGGFSYLFNVFHEAAHPINASMRLPEDFSPFNSEMSSSDIDEFKEYSAGSYLADESLVRMDGGDDRFKTILKTSAPHAAVLMMPEAVNASKLQSTILLRKYIRDNIRSWYRFVRTVLGREVDNGDLRVVYGCRKSTAFGIATVANGGAADASTELTFSVDDSWTEVTGCKYGWHHRGSAVVKSGPSLDENQKIQQERDLAIDENLRSAHIINQCLFVSTIDFTLPDGEWERIDDNETVSVTTSDHPNMQSGSTSPSAMFLTSRTSIQSNAGYSSSSTSGSSKELDATHQSAGISGRLDETEWPTLPPSKRLFHPSDALAQFLLQVVPQATSVALCSDDWGAHMTSSVQTVGALIDDVLSAHDIYDDDGMIYLSPKEKNSPIELQTLTDVTTESLAEGDPPHDSSSAHMTTSIKTTAALTDGIFSTDDICEDDGMVHLISSTTAKTTTMMQPTCTGLRVRTPVDAHLIFHAVHVGILRMIPRRLDTEERRAISSGCVYVWEERGSNVGTTGQQGIERWTDSITWGPSRVNDDFLFYNEKRAVSLEAYMSLSNSSDTNMTQRPLFGRRHLRQPLTKQTYSVYVETQTGRRKWHLIAYFAPETVDKLNTVQDHPMLASLRVPKGMYISARNPKSMRLPRGSRGINADTYPGNEPRDSSKSSPSYGAQDLSPATLRYANTLAPLSYLNRLPPPRRHPLDELALMSFPGVR